MMASLAARCLRLPSILRRNYQFRCLSTSLPLLLPKPCATRQIGALPVTGLSKRLAAASIGGARILFTFSVPLDLFKKAEESYQHTHVKILPNRPTHAYQPRTEYQKELGAAISCRPNQSGDVVMAVYVKGEPASGKTQVAREFGEAYYQLEQELKRHRVTVATLYARSESAFARSFLRLALDLGCPSHGLQSGSTLEDHLTRYSAEIQQKLKESTRQDWLLIIDGMTTKSMLMIIKSVHCHSQ